MKVGDRFELIKDTSLGGEFYKEGETGVIIQIIDDMYIDYPIFVAMDNPHPEDIYKGEWAVSADEIEILN